MKTNADEQNEGSAQNQQISPGPAVKPTRPSNRPDARGENKQGEEIKALSKRVDLGLWFSGVVAATAIVSSYVAYLQWNAIRGGGEQTDQLIAQVTEQAKAANRLAEIARDSLAESRRHFQADQRPFIISNVAPRAPKVGASLEARVSMINYGKTPALQVGTYATVLIGPDALKQADRWFANDRQQKFDTSIGNIIPPGIPVGLSREIPISSIKKLTPEDMETLISQDNQAVFVARHLYFDTAGNSFGTDSCYRLLKGWVTAFCERHNEMHEDYKEYPGGCADHDGYRSD